MPKNKPNKGLLKRIKVTKTGKVRFRRAHGRHLRSRKSSSLLQSYRKASYASSADMRRIRAMTFKSIRSSEAAKADSGESSQD